MIEKNSPTVFDVAKLAGVSPSTVSRVMRNSDNVKEETVKKVLAAAETLDYRRTSAKGNQKKDWFYAVIIPNILDPFFTNALKGILDQAKLYNTNIIVYCSENNPAKDYDIFKKLVSMELLDGLLIIPSGYDEDFYADISEDPKLPTVFLDRTPKNYSCSSVTTNDFDGALQATKHLITLGHRNLLYMGGQKELSTERERLRGFLTALKDYDIDFNPANIYEDDFNFESAYKTAKQIIKKKTPFTAAFAANDLIALGLKLALEENGILVPNDVSIVGYGDMTFANYMFLTSVSSPSYEIGKNAYLLLYNILKKRVENDQKIILRPSLIIRDTCKALNGPTNNFNV